MTEHPGVPPDHRRVERAIVLQLLRDDHGERWSRTELQAALNIEPSALSAGARTLGATRRCACPALMSSWRRRARDALTSWS